MGLSKNDSVYSCLFFFLTALHFFHLLVGLFLCCLSFYNCSFIIGKLINVLISFIFWSTNSWSNNQPSIFFFISESTAGVRFYYWPQNRIFLLLGVTLRFPGLIFWCHRFLFHFITITRQWLFYQLLFIFILFLDLSCYPWALSYGHCRFYSQILPVTFFYQQQWPFIIPFWALPHCH